MRDEKKNFDLHFGIKARLFKPKINKIKLENCLKVLIIRIKVEISEKNK